MKYTIFLLFLLLLSKCCIDIVNNKNNKQSNLRRVEQVTITENSSIIALSLFGLLLLTIKR